MRARPRKAVIAASAVFAAVAAAILIGAEPPRAQACAIVAPGHDIPVAMSYEEAVIVWDEAAKVEHFIRRATFATEAKDFGFLVPTPSRPTLHEAEPEIFDAFARFTNARTTSGFELRPERISLALSWLLRPMNSEEPPDRFSYGVRILEERDIAGMHAAVIEAERADLLVAWLEENRYPSSPSLEAWLAPYIARRFVITAFKIGAPSPSSATASHAIPHGGSLAPRAVRLSFATERPFYPYREPEARGAESRGSTSAGRVLRLYFVAPARARADLEETASGEWSARVRTARPIEPGRVAATALALLAEPRAITAPAEAPSARTATGFVVAGEPLWLTEFIDPSRERPPADVYFTASSLPSEAYPPGPPIEVPPIPIPSEIIVPLAIFFWVRRRRARATRSL